MKRTDPQPIGKYIDEIFNSPDIRAKIAEGSLPETWRKVVGTAIAEQTLQVRLVKGTFHVHVQSGVVRKELMMQRDALVRAINAQSGVNLVADILVR